MTAKQERTYHVPEQPVPTTVKVAAYGYRCSSCGATGDFLSKQWLYGPKSPLSAFMFCRSCVTISDIYDVLPLTEKTLLKRMMRGYSPALRLRNDTGRSGDYRVLIGDRELGIVIYAGGRKLTCHGIKPPYSKDGRLQLCSACGNYVPRTANVCPACDSLCATCGGSGAVEVGDENGSHNDPCPDCGGIGV